MGRWTQYDEDEYRLPEGMKRIGYDSDTGRYYFQDQAGVVWQGAEGEEFGQMTRVSSGSSSTPQVHQNEDVEAVPTRSDGYQALPTDHAGTTMAYKQNVNAGAYRTLFPFFLIIAVVLLLVWRLILSPGLASPATMCPKKTVGYWVQPGDSCWDISNAHGCSLEEFMKINPKVECSSLIPGMTVCLPNSPQSAPT